MRFSSCKWLQIEFLVDKFFSRNLLSMLKMSVHFFRPEKRTTGSLDKSFGGYFWSTALTPASFWPSTRCTRPHKFASVSAESNHNRSEGCWTPRVCAITAPLLFIIYTNWIDSHSRDNESVTIGSCRINRFFSIWRYLHPLNRRFHHALNRFVAACDQAGMKIKTKRPTYYVSLKIQASVCYKYATIDCGR